MMHEGAEHSDGLNQIVLSSKMYGAVKGSLPLARRAKEQGINDTLPIAVRMLSVLKRHAQRRCIDQGSRTIGWELLQAGDLWKHGPAVLPSTRKHGPAVLPSTRRADAGTADCK